ncbi:glycosyltransferase family 39 protein [bacterium]|nr:glycosyltransferase family 39 protein [bacterium]
MTFVRPDYDSVPGSQLSLRLADYSLLTLFCSLLFGVSLVGGRYLTMHEAVLPQSAKEMYANHEWLVPTSAGRPWLERPPLPQWITMLSAHVVGRFDQEWIVRLPAAIVALLTVLIVAGLSAYWFGRSMGLLSGLCLATCLEFTRYAWLAEQDIYLSLLVTMAVAFFGYMEFRPRASLPTSRSFFGTRPASILVWFVLLGMTNLAKGLAFGTAMAVLPVLAFMLWNASLYRIQRYVWFWGWLATAAIALAWPIAVCIRHPDVVALWHYDLFGRLSGQYEAINQPAWYYAANLPLIIAPWFLIAILGMGAMARTAWNTRFSPERFIWCWLWVPILVFSIPAGKHHHYMLPCLAPWAMASARGLIELRRWSLSWPSWLKSPIAGALFVGLPLALAIGFAGPVLPGPAWVPVVAIVVCVAITSLSALGLHHRSAVVSAMTVFGLIGTTYIGGLIYAARHFDECRTDTRFFQLARQESTDRGLPVYVNADLRSMDVFRILFYLGDDARSVHNLTFLRDEKIHEPAILVLTRAKDQEKLQRLGKVEELGRSGETRREGSPGDRFALFELTYRTDLVRHQAPPRVSPMQAMDREEGPYLGGRF